MGHIWGRQDPDGLHVGPINLALWVTYFVAHILASMGHYTIVRPIHELSNKSLAASCDCRSCSAYWLMWATFLFWRPLKLRTNLKKYRGIGEVGCRKRSIIDIHNFDKLWPSDIIWQQGLVQVITCCLVAPSYYLNQRWPIIIEVVWHS